MDGDEGGTQEEDDAISVKRFRLPGCFGGALVFDCTCTFGSFNLVGFFDIASKPFCTIIGIEIDCLHQNEDAL